MKNKKIIAFLVFFLLLFSLQVSAKEKVYEEKNMYSFAVPENWEQIPKGAMYEIIKGSENAFKVEEEGIDYVQYKVAFQQKNEQYFRYPFTLVKYKKTTMVGTTEELETLAGTINKSKMAKEYEKTGIKISNLKVGYLKVDKEKKTILVISNGTVGTKQMAFTSMIFLGKEKIVQMDFFTFQENYQALQSEIQTFMDSFSFEESKESEVKTPVKEEPKENPKEEVKEEPKEKVVVYTKENTPEKSPNLIIMIGMLVVVIALGVVGFIVWRKLKQRKEEKLIQQSELFLHDDEDDDEGDRSWYGVDEDEEIENNVDSYGYSKDEDEDVYKYGNRYYNRDKKDDDDDDDDENEDYGFNDYYRRDGE